MRSRYGRVFLDFSSEINGEIVVNPSGLLPGPSDLYLLSLQKDSLLWSNLTSQELKKMSSKRQQCQGFSLFGEKLLLHHTCNRRLYHSRPLLYNYTIDAV